MTVGGAEDTALEGTEETIVELRDDGHDKLIDTKEPPKPSERDSFIIQNAPALVDDDPTRFGLVDFLSAKGAHNASL